MEPPSGGKQGGCGHHETHHEQPEEQQTHRYARGLLVRLQRRVRLRADRDDEQLSPRRKHCGSCFCTDGQQQPREPRQERQEGQEKEEGQEARQGQEADEAAAESQERRPRQRPEVHGEDAVESGCPLRPQRPGLRVLHGLCYRDGRRVCGVHGILGL